MGPYGDNDSGYGGPGEPMGDGYGRARVPRDGDWAGDGGPPPGGRPDAGRATVPGAPGRAGVPGRAAVPGRASVRPSGLDGDYGDEPDRPRGRGQGGDVQRRDVQGAQGAKVAKPKKRRRGKILIAAFASILILFGVGAIGFTYYFDSVEDILPDKINTAQTTMIMAADGTTQLAQLGTDNRVNVPMDSIPDQVRKTLIAGEDKGFFQHHGISYSGIARAAWNNISGGHTQGASTITQQYVKLATAQSQISYARKLREAVLARKLEDKYSKLAIMGFYLNTVDFGRGAIGVEKAAQAYFGHGASKLTVPEAAVLGSVIRDPYADNGALSIYDPEAHPDTAQDRWNYVLKNMVEMGWLSQADKDAMQLPKTKSSKDVLTSAEWGIKIQEGTNLGKATGNVVNYVYAELKAKDIEPKDLRTGGYRITTTIDPRAQKIVEAAARPDIKGSAIYGRKPDTDKYGNKRDLESAAVMIDPKNGRVIAYYGGIDGTGNDFAGVNSGGSGLYGGHEPGSSMKVYTLAAALEAGASLQSRWKAMPFTTDDHLKIGNADAPNTGCKDYCTLEYSLMKSYNVPFYWVARQIGPGKVVQMAHAAGINTMWDNNGKAHNLNEEIQDDTARTPFDRQVGYGQYGITVLDHASGIATFANGGVYNKPHFVLKVEQKDPVSGEYKEVADKKEKLEPKAAIRPEVANDVTAAMVKVFHDHSGWASYQDNRDVASKTGTWEGSIVKDGKSTPTKENAHAWVVGFTKQVALAVWTGNAASQAPVIDPVTGSSVTSGTTPYRIWRDILSKYSAGMPKEKLASGSGVGDDDFAGANGVSPAPSAPPVSPSSQPCDPVTCPSASPSASTGGGGGPSPGGSPKPSPSPKPLPSATKKP